jgi:Tfp pilus assembly protein PilO
MPTTMTTRTRALLCILTFVITFAVAYAGIVPAFSEFQLKSATLKEKREENQQYVNKLTARSKAEIEKRGLEKQIEDLRKSVPKEPNLDLVMLDLEKMCNDSHIDMVGVENIEQEALAKMQAADKPKATVNGLLKPLSEPLAHLGLKPGQKKESDVAEQSAFKQLHKQVYLSGDYDGFVKMMHRMETYQRVISFNNIVISSPSTESKDASAAKAEKLKIKRPLMSFIMTIYYLP